MADEQKVTHVHGAGFVLGVPGLQANTSVHEDEEVIELEDMQAAQPSYERKPRRIVLRNAPPVAQSEPNLSEQQSEPVQSDIQSQGLSVSAPMTNGG